jgi:hypothetical protein
VQLRRNDRSSLLYAMHGMRERLTDIMRSVTLLTQSWATLRASSMPPHMRWPVPPANRLPPWKKSTAPSAA